MDSGWKTATLFIWTRPSCSAVGRHDTVLIKAIGIMKAEHDAKKEAGTLRVYTPGAEEGTDTGLCADADVPITVGELNDEQAF